MGRNTSEGDSALAEFVSEGGNHFKRSGSRLKGGGAAVGGKKFMQRLFFGTHINRLDSKGRVSIPASFRQALSEDGNAAVVCFPSLNAPVIEGVGEDYMGRLQRGITHNHDVFSQESDALATSLFADATRLAWDSGGRIQLPPLLLAFAGIGEVAVFVGIGERFRILNEERGAQEQAAAKRLVAEKRLTVSISSRRRRRDRGGDGSRG